MHTITFSARLAILQRSLPQYYCPIQSGTDYLATQFGMNTTWAAFWADFSILVLFLAVFLLLMFVAIKRINHLQR
jgi:hypothetical protein